MEISILSMGRTEVSVTKPSGVTQVEVLGMTSRTEMTVAGGPPGPTGPRGADAVGSADDPGDLTLIFDNKLI